jgi:FixJ family two-component response regulator
MNSPETVVYIVDDDPSFRRSMERLVSASGYAVEAFDSAHSFLANAVIRHPACLLLDVRLPDADGLSFQKELGAKGFTLPVIFMTGHGTIPMGVQAMKNGAIDFLPKPFEKKDLLNAIEKALERDLLDTQGWVERESINTRIETLTPREKEVLRWIITGKPNKKIAEALGTTEKTVKVHRSRVMQKTKVSSVAELVRLAEKVSIFPAV